MDKEAIKPNGSNSGRRLLYFVSMLCGLALVAYWVISDISSSKERNINRVEVIKEHTFTVKLRDNVTADVKFIILDDVIEVNEIMSMRRAIEGLLIAYTSDEMEKYSTKILDRLSVIRKEKAPSMNNTRIYISFQLKSQSHTYSITT